MNVDSLKSEFRGELLTPGSDGYDAARRLWNGMIDRRPAVIARCTGPEDVMAVVRFAARENIYPAVRAGGHGAAGLASVDDGLVIDVSPMKRIEVDANARTATAESGLTWGEFDRSTQAHGLATTGGLVSTTGIAGLTLGGGVGWLMGQHGLSCDNTLSYDIVTADGELITASADAHPDLFWALKGGSGNFGVVTSITYRLHPVGAVISGMLLHPLARAPEVLRFYRDFVLAGLPDELIVYAAAVTGPDGTPLLAIVPSWTGADLDEGERVLAPLRGFRSAGRRSRDPHAVHGDAADARHRRRLRPSELLEIALPQRTAGRRDRHVRALHPVVSVAANARRARARARRSDARRCRCDGVPDSRPCVRLRRRKSLARRRRRRSQRCVDTLLLPGDAAVVRCAGLRQRARR